MLIRSSIYPRSFKDAFVTGFVLTIMPIIYYFELFVVLPKYYRLWSLAYTFHFLMGTFILFEVCANLVAVMLCDTSIKGRVLHVEWKEGSRFCAVCETIAPPRSWHCDVCNVCILKRDHHCVFTSYCIGNDNHRFFMMFVFYMFVATTYASYYNLAYLEDFISFDSWMSLLKIVFPLAMIFMEWTENQVYVFFIIIVLLGCAFTGVLLYFHVNLMLKSLVTHERSHRSKYDRGSVIKNVEIVMGERWYLTWISPFIESKLPCNGVDWDEMLSSKTQ